MDVDEVAVMVDKVANMAADLFKTNINSLKCSETKCVGPKLFDV